MAFITVNDIAQSGYGDLFLKSTIVSPSLVSRNPERIFPNGKGYQAQFKLPTEPTARVRTNQAGDITVDSINETSVTIDMNYNVYAALEVTNEQHLFSLESAMEQVVAPMINTVNAQLEAKFCADIVKGFARYVSGTQGTNPSTLAHLSAVEKVIFDNKGSTQSLVGLINSTAHSSLTQINQNVSSDFQGDAAYMALRENRLNALAGMQLFRSHGCANSLDRGDIAGTVLVDGVQTTATANQVVVNGFTAATGVVKEGTRLILATSGGGVVFTVTADTAIAGNAATLPIFPARTASTTNDEVVTFQTAVTSNVVFNPRGVMGGVIAGPASSDAVTLNAGPIQLQLISLPRGKDLKQIWVLQGYQGCKVIRPEFGAILQG
jgi:hypothetical protein